MGTLYVLKQVTHDEIIINRSPKYIKKVIKLVMKDVMIVFNILLVIPFLCIFHY
jgi:hypothetical protein